MRAAVILVLVASACATQPRLATSPTPSPTASATATPRQTPTSSPTASLTPIVLPTITQLSAPSGTVVWALVGGVNLYRSSDRGDTWEERSLPGRLPNADIAFASDKEGFLFGAGSPTTQCQSQTVALWRTTGGAGPWQQVTPTGIADAMCKQGISSGDSTHAFLTTISPNAGSLIYRTADAGASWTASAPLPIPPNLASHGALFVQITSRPRAFGSVVLVAGGAGQTKDVFRSTDGGATFTYASTVAADGNVVYLTASRWLDFAPNSSMETTDGGATWHAFMTDYNQAAPIAPDLVFGDAQVGYATVRGAIQRTTDGGAHWTTIRTPGT
jgi:photosystem II stability/assembly factor-like uncharacterized protein